MTISHWLHRIIHTYKLLRRTAQHIPVRRPGITTGFSTGKKLSHAALGGWKQPHQVYNGTVLENAESFVYLGSEFTWNNDCSRDIRRRIQLVTGAYGDLQPIWKDKGLSTEIKMQLLYNRRACVTI